MKVRLFCEDDVREVSRWFRDVQWPLPPSEGLLPRDGFVAETESYLVGCAFLYTTGTSLGVISWINSNPDVDWKTQTEGLTSIIKKIQEVAQNISPKINQLVIHTKSEEFAKRLKDLDFKTHFGFYQATWVSNPGPSSKAGGVANI